ncbi:hypothetical protein GGR56DRAFT_652723 [Xylariaceae sp. FL0804]|nr:hypothetical protein GGR56DRAFT_652723 [Xylariaceae sp. FL0804]
MSQPPPPPSHARAVEAFRKELGDASREVVEEMMRYEKEFLERMKHEDSKVVQSFLAQ